MTKLTTRKASWKRFRDMVDLALLNKTLNIQSAVDVGTDHGFLAVCLAATGSFGKGVLGVDVSEKALQTGAFRLEGKLQEYWRETNKNPLALSFQVGDGIRSLEPGQADVICAAGMGVNTILEILTQAKDGEPLLSVLGCQRLVLQPTNSRPRNLMTLYKGLESIGWSLNEERIQQVGSRWYVSLSFEPDNKMSDDKEQCVPGMKLLDSTSSTFQDYLEHHYEWLCADLRVAGKLQDGEAEWLEAFEPIVNRRQSTKQ